MAENIMARPRQETEVKIENRGVIKDSQDAPFEPGKLEIDKNIPISLYEQRFHKPYAAEFFGLDNNFLINLDKTTTDKLQNIDKFVLEQIAHLELADSKKSYNTILNKLLILLGVDENEKVNSKLDKLNTVVLIRKMFR